MALIRRLPRIDLHMHLEGSLPRSTIRSLAARHGVPVPRVTGFRGLPGFLRAFGALCDLLRDEEDFLMAARSVILQARRAGCAHVEILFSPQVFMRRGIPAGRIIAGLLRARKEAAGRALSVAYIADGVRQWGAEWFEETVRLLSPWSGGGIAGIGVGGDERAIPARQFTRAFRTARRLGFRTTVHAGETGEPDAVAEALRWLDPDRIGHGIGAASDPGLLRRIARSGITLEVCPGSNLATGSVRSGREHPLRALLDAGVHVTLNSDDGTFFGTDVANELHRAVRVMGLDAAELILVVRNAAAGAFLPPRRRAGLDRRILAAAAADGGI